MKVEGSQAALNAPVLAELVGLVAAGELEVRIAATFPLADVRAAFNLLEQGHTRGKIVLLPRGAINHQRGSELWGTLNPALQVGKESIYIPAAVQQLFEASGSA